jgi:hypothetical protein
MSQQTPTTVIIKVLDDLFDGYGVSGGDARQAACGLMEQLDRAGYVIAPREPTDGMYMRGGNVPLSNVGKNSKSRRGRIGDMAAADAWRVMALVAREANRNDILERKPL